jgi:hypothetical protein
VKFVVAFLFPSDHWREVGDPIHSLADFGDATWAGKRADITKPTEKAILGQAPGHQALTVPRLVWPQGRDEVLEQAVNALKE